jgi:carbonic anhydrase
LIDQLSWYDDNISKRGLMKKQLLLSLFFISTALLSCSVKSKKSENVQPPSAPIQNTPVEISSAPPTANPAPASPLPLPGPSKEIPPQIQKLTGPVTASSSTKELSELKETLKKAEVVTLHPSTTGVSAEKALNWLKNGNIRFTKGYLRHDGASKKDVDMLAAKQAPHSIVLSCSDSRVPPEVVFDQKLGEIFVVRTAGQSLDNSSLASIEYAVEHLHSQLLVVMGHTSCGAVKAAVSTAPGGDIGSPYLNALVADIQPRLSNKSNAKPSENYLTESWENTQGAAKALLEKSTIVREAVKSGHLRLTTALYHLDSGAVEWGKK